MAQAHVLFAAKTSRDHRDHPVAHTSSKTQDKHPYRAGAGAVTVQTMMMTMMTSSGKQPPHGVYLSEAQEMFLL